MRRLHTFQTTPEQITPLLGADGLEHVPAMVELIVATLDVANAQRGERWDTIDSILLTDDVFRGIAHAIIFRLQADVGDFIPDDAPMKARALASLARRMANLRDRLEPGALYLLETRDLCDIKHKVTAYLAVGGEPVESDPCP